MLYPQLWGLKGPHPNIDHRRVQNQMRFFERHGRSLTLSLAPRDRGEWWWGDVVYWRAAAGRPGPLRDCVRQAGCFEAPHGDPQRGCRP
ncbi:MAG: DUF1287 domain-containing protein [Bacillota bacterium]